MSVRKAFEVLESTLGEDFKYKGDFSGFAKVVMSEKPILRGFRDYMQEKFPEAKYVYFWVTYDSVNRRNTFGDYEIVSKDNVIIATDTTLRRKFPEEHNAIFSFIYDGLVPEVYVDDEYEGQEYRFCIETLEYLGLEDYENDQDYLSKTNGNLIRKK